MNGLPRASRSVRRVFLACACSLAFLTVSVLADEAVCDGCACDCKGSVACGICVGYVINSCCSGSQPAGCCSATCQGGHVWEVRCSAGGETFVCTVNLGEPCIE